MAQDLILRNVTNQIARILVDRRRAGGCALDREVGHRLQRPALRFRSVNVAGRPGYDAGLQRHHLLPRQLLSKPCFGPLFAAIGHGWPGFDDFRTNGLLLPGNDTAALQTGLPLHRGPHRAYNALVMERVGTVEARWAGARRHASAAQADAILELQGIQHDLRFRLLDAGRQRLELNRRDPLSQLVDFAELDTLADALRSACIPWLPVHDHPVDQPAVPASARVRDDAIRAAKAAWA